MQSRVVSDDAYAEHLLSYAKEKNVEISSLAFYPNTMDGKSEKRNAAVEHLKNVILRKRETGRKYGDNIYRKRSDKNSRGKPRACKRNLASDHETGGGTEG